MVATVDERGLEVHGRVVREDTVLHLHLEALVDGRHVFLRHRTTDRLVFEHEARTRLKRLKRNNHASELS